MHDNWEARFYNGAMLHWVIRRRMRGGLVFGPPAWMPERVEETFETPATKAAASAMETSAEKPNAVQASAGTADMGAVAPTSVSATAMPGDQGELMALVERLGIGRTSAVIPGLGEQLRAGEGAVKQLVLNLLPTQPESALGGVLAHAPGAQAQGRHILAGWQYDRLHVIRR